MYLDHFGLKEPPFRITPDTDFFFQGANRGATLEALLYAITHDEGIVKVSGEVGSGKTMLCRVLMERLPATVETIYLANPSLSRDEILLAIGDELKLELEKGQTTRILRAAGIRRAPRRGRHAAAEGAHHSQLSPGAPGAQRHRELHRLSHARRRLPRSPDFQSESNQGHFERVQRTDAPGQYPVGQGPARGLRIRHPCGYPG